MGRIAGYALGYGSVIVNGMPTSVPFASTTVIFSNPMGVTRIVLPSISTTRKWFCGDQSAMFASAILR